jgi:hypothetical protein
MMSFVDFRVTFVLRILIGLFGKRTCVPFPVSRYQSINLARAYLRKELKVYRLWVREDGCLATVLASCRIFRRLIVVLTIVRAGSLSIYYAWSVHSNEKCFKLTSAVIISTVFSTKYLGFSVTW